jgi:Tol biopolymer transport system component
VLGAGLALGLLGPPTTALAGPPPQRTVRVRLAAVGSPNGPSGAPALSADGRRLAFASEATNLTAHGDGNGAMRDIFVYDQGTGVITLVSSGPGGEPADASSDQPVLDADGSHLAFASRARNLVANDRNRFSDVFVLVPEAGLARASIAPGGGEGDGPSSEPDLSADGRLLVFTSAADNLVTGDSNQAYDVFVRDLVTGVTTLVSGGRRGAPAAGDASAPAISADGRFVSFSSDAPNLVPGDDNGHADVFVRELATGRTRLVSVARGGGGQNAARSGGRALVSDISGDGRFVVFESDATNLAGRDRNRRTDVFVRDTGAGTTRRVSLSTTNEEGSGASSLPTITPDGRYVAFASNANDLVAEDAQGPDVFVRELARETTVLVDVTARGRLRGREVAVPPPGRPSLSADGATAAFASSASNFVGTDANRVADVFLRRLEPAASATADRRVGLVRGRLLIVFRSADREPSPLQCRLDRGPPTLCPLGGLLLPKLHRGLHVLRAFAGAPGAHYARRPIVIRMTIGKGRPRVRVENPGDQF